MNESIFLLRQLFLPFRLNNILWCYLLKSCCKVKKSSVVIRYFTPLLTQYLLVAIGWAEQETDPTPNILHTHLITIIQDIGKFALSGINNLFEGERAAWRKFLHATSADKKWKLIEKKHKSSKIANHIFSKLVGITVAQ